MNLCILKDDCLLRLHANRDSTRNHWGREGFCLYIGDLRIDFEDEADAEKVARMILARLGINYG